MPFSIDLSQQAHKAKHDGLVALVNQIEQAVAAEQVANTPGGRMLAQKRTGALRNQLTDEVSALYGVTSTEVSLVDRLVE